MRGHTPGPWLCENVADREGAIGVFNARGESYRVALVPLRFESGEREANAQLIAAAPDLLAALRDTMDLWGSNAPHDFDVCEDPACGCVRQRAARAIAKAEGRS